MEHLHRLEKDDIHSDNIKKLPLGYKIMAQDQYGAAFSTIIKEHFRSDYELFEEFLKHTNKKEEVLTWLEGLSHRENASKTTDETKKQHAEGTIEKDLYNALIAKGYIEKEDEDAKKDIAQYGSPLVHAAQEYSSMSRFKSLLDSFDSKKYKDLFIYVNNSIAHTDKISSTVQTATNSLINLLQKSVDSKMKSISVEVGADVFDDILDYNKKGQYYIIAPNHMIAENFYTKNFLLPYDFYALQQLFERNGSGCGPVALVNRPAQAALEKLGFSSESTEETLKYFVGTIYDGVPVFKNRADTTNAIKNSRRNHAVFMSKKNKPTNIVLFPTGNQTKTLEEQFAEDSLIKTTVFNDKWFPGRPVVPVYIEEHTPGEFCLAFGEPMDVTKPEGVSRAAHLKALRTQYKNIMFDLRARLHNVHMHKEESSYEDEEAQAEYINGGV